MEQRFLTQEERQREERHKQEAERLSQQETLSATQLETALPVGSRLDPEVVDGLMRPLSEEERVRADPCRTLPHQRAALLEQLTRQARSQQRRSRWYWAVYLIGAALFSGLNLAYFFGHVKYLEDYALPLNISYVATLLCVKQAEKRWGRVAEQMALFDDPGAAGPLMEGLALGDQAAVAVAVKALSRLLPRLQASDASSITETQRVCLCRRLTCRYAQRAPDFVIAALRALEQIGDAKALPSVEALAANTSTTTNALRVREAAQHCLAFLKARVQEKQWSDHLLRASSGQEASSDTLLRPAGDSPPSDPKHLLRSSSPKDS